MVREPHRPILTPFKPGVHGADGTPIKTLGTAELPLVLGGKTYPCKVIIAEISSPGILGMNFFVQYECDLIMTNAVLVCKRTNHHIPMVQGKNAHCNRVTVAATTLIPPRTEIIILGNLHRHKTLNGVAGVISAATHDGEACPVAVPHVLVDTLHPKVPILVSNIASIPIELMEGEQIAWCEPVGQIDRTIYGTEDIMFMEAEGGTPDKEECEINPPSSEVEEYSGVPEHLKVLLTEIALVPEQRNRVAQLVTKHRDAFIGASGEIGRTRYTRGMLLQNASPPDVFPQVNKLLSRRKLIRCLKGKSLNHLAVHGPVRLS
jgi:hypothetical protein